jgi:hypothetical protein
MAPEGAAQFFVPGQAPGVTIFGKGVNSAVRVLVLSFKADGTVSVSGTGFGQDELDAMREQVKGQSGVLRINIPGTDGETVLPRPAKGEGTFTYVLPQAKEEQTGEQAAPAAPADSADDGQPE